MFVIVPVGDNCRLELDIYFYTVVISFDDERDNVFTREAVE